MNERIKMFKGSEVDIEYIITGENNSETIIFLHGVGMNLRQFFKQHEYFSSKYKVISVSLRGHGFSGHPESKHGGNYTIEKNKNDLLELLEFLDISKVNFVGNSAGGVIGLHIAKERPDLLISLTTFGTTAEMNYSALMTKIISSIDKIMLRWNPKGYLDFFSKHTSKYKQSQKEIFNMFMMSIQVIPYIRNNLGNYSYIDTIKEMSIPYLLIKGEEDKEINKNLRFTLDQIKENKNAKVAKILKAGHITNLDRPDEFNKTLKNFLTYRKVL